MRFKLDENLPVELVAELERRGHDVDSVAGEGLTGEPDPRIVAAAAADRRVLLTLDKGLASILRYPPGSHAGVVLLRPASAGRRTALAFALRHLPRVESEDLSGRITVVTETAIRTR